MPQSNPTQLQGNIPLAVRITDLQIVQIICTGEEERQRKGQLSCTMEQQQGPTGAPQTSIT